jgi:ABC-type uncharacterized transport system ATPase subunit
MTGQAEVPRLQLINISKTFPGGIRANDKVSLTVDRGEVHCLLGENGAGKTTLMNIVYGMYQADEGEIYLNGERVLVNSPHEALAHKVGMVHQHFMLIPTLTVAENIILGMKPLASRLGDLKAIEKEITRVAMSFGMSIKPSALVKNLSVGEQQRVEIIKALYRGVDLLILDEPTAVLTPQETRDLFATLKELTRQGLSIIFITHKLNEALAVADRVSVLRDGRMIATMPIGEATLDNLAEMMVGREVSFNLERPPLPCGKPVLEVQGLSYRERDSGEHYLLKDVTFEVCEGEILGIAGVDGNGQSQLAQVITGLLKPSAGKVIINGKEVTRQAPRVCLEAGLGHIPEDRTKMGLVPEYSVAYNFILQRYNDRQFQRGGLLNMEAIRSFAQRLVKAFDVRTPSVDTRVASLSGGNQQKIILGREIDRNPKLLVAVQPTRGLDIGATEYIHKKLLMQRAQGAAILLISTELEEILALSDRIAVIYEGQIMGIVPGDRSLMKKIGLMMAGIRENSGE